MISYLHFGRAACGGAVWLQMPWYSSTPTKQIFPQLQVVGVLLVSGCYQSAAEGEVGKGPNDCYASMPTVLPITISYSKSSNSSATSFNFLVGSLVNQLCVLCIYLQCIPSQHTFPASILVMVTLLHITSYIAIRLPLVQVNPRSPKVTAFGIRLNDDLAHMSSRLSSIPEGQFVPQGPAYLWQITKPGSQTYTFIVNTTGLTQGAGPNSVPDLTDLCAQGIQVADDAGNLIWQQETTGSSCV